MNAVITGATKGMGKAITIKLAEAGYNIIICSRNQSEADSFCRELTDKHPSIRALALETDCSNPKDVNRFSDFVQQHFEFVDVLINNVGTFRPGGILDEEEENLHIQLQINFLTAYTLCREVGRKMREAKKGHIFNIASIAAIKPVTEAGSYSVTKAALLSLTRVLRQDLMKHGVKVTSILPGSTLTHSWEGTSIPSERFIAAKDVAHVILSCLNMSTGANPDEIVITPLEGNI